MNYNKAIIAGNLTKDPERRVTDSGTAVVNFTVASNRHYTTDDGTRKQDTEFHDIVFFGKTAENIKKYLTKGSSALVEGRLQTRSWEDKNGTKRYRTEIVGRNIQFGPNKNNRPDDTKHQGSTPRASETKKEDIPVIEDDDINVDDIPFD